MRYHRCDIVFQEVPGEISLSLSISGCPIRCSGCHSPELWPARNGSPLGPTELTRLLDRYEGLVTNVLFLGGEWHRDLLISLLRQARARGLRTALYTGLHEKEVNIDLKRHLTYLKSGPWVAARGGLADPGTNQIFRDLRTGAVLNHLFHRS